MAKVREFGYCKNFEKEFSAVNQENKKRSRPGKNRDGILEMF
jgi:hypothetical protein